MIASGATRPARPDPARVVALLVTAAILALAAAGASDWRRDAAPTPHAPIQAVHAEAAGEGAGAAASPAASLHVIACEKLPNAPGKSITTAFVDMPPNAFTPAHRHPGSVTAVVLAGIVRSQLNGGPILEYPAGQSWFEPPGTLHSFAANPSPTRPARLLAIFVADDDCGPLTVFEK